MILLKNIVRKLLIPLASSFLLVAPAFADFGSADTGQLGGNEVSSFKAKCGEERKACNLEIDFKNESFWKTLNLRLNPFWDI